MFNIQLSQSFIQKRVFRIFRNSPAKHFTIKQIIKKYKRKESSEAIVAAINGLVNKDLVVVRHNNKFKLKSPNKQIGKTVEGIVDMAVGGFAFVISEQIKEDIYISPKNLGTALDGDKVKISLHKSGRRRRQEGKIIELIERAQVAFLGILQISKGFAFVVPDKKNMPVDISVSLNKLKGAKEGDKVVAEIIDWTPDLPNPLGEITHLLGKSGDNDVEMKSILLEHGFKLEFPRGE